MMTGGCVNPNASAACLACMAKAMLCCLRKIEIKMRIPTRFVHIQLSLLLFNGSLLDQRVHSSAQPAHAAHHQQVQVAHAAM